MNGFFISFEARVSVFLLFPSFSFHTISATGVDGSWMGSRFRFTTTTDVIIVSTEHFGTSASTEGSTPQAMAPYSSLWTEFLGPLCFFILAPYFLVDILQDGKGAF